MSLKITRCLFQSETMTMLVCLLFPLFWSLVTLLVYFSHHVSLYPHCLSVNAFLTEKEEIKHEKYAPMGFELLTSRVTIQHVSHWGRYLCITFKSLKVFILCRPKFIAHPIPQFWQKKIILPFLTAAQRKHVQIHVIKTCRQASVTVW